MGDVIVGILAVIIGVAASYGLYWLLNQATRLLPSKWQPKAAIGAFLLPALVLLILILLVPLLVTIMWSFKDDRVKEWVGIQNYIDLFTSLDFLGILLNNFLWVAIVPAVIVAVGTLVAALTNQVGPSRERIFKSIIFMPMAISFVAASTIWAYMYVYVPPGRPEIGLLNAIVTALGGEAQPWLTMDQARLNSFLLMAVLVWLQVGFAMVIISASIKGVPTETIEAGRIDGANGVQIFFKVILPQIRPTIVAVFITVLILVMKIFDIILAMTGGNFNTSVLAYEYYEQFFVNSNTGPASAVVVILCVFIAPLMWLQVRTVRQQETMQ